MFTPCSNSRNGLSTLCESVVKLVGPGGEAKAKPRAEIHELNMWHLSEMQTPSRFWRQIKKKNLARGLPEGSGGTQLSDGRGRWKRWKRKWGEFLLETRLPATVERGVRKKGRFFFLNHSFIFKRANHQFSWTWDFSSLWCHKGHPL